MSNKLKVLVLMGGNSSEKDVSIASGNEVLRNLDKEKYESDAVVLNDKHNNLKLNKKVDVVFIAMHGAFGEDGTVQGLLDFYGIPYTGSGVMASAVCMDKKIFREIMTAIKVEIPKYEVMTPGINKEAKFPCFVKPNNQGSSIGASIATNKKELEKSLVNAFKYSNNVLVDELLTGREFTCAVTGNLSPIALPVVEIIPVKGDFFDYESKYLAGGANEIVPANISDNLRDSIQKTAVKIYKHLGCRGFARIDFMLKDSGEPVVLEVNTIPGLTSMSIFPKAAKAAGISYPQLLDKIINYALEK